MRGIRLCFCRVAGEVEGIVFGGEKPIIGQDFDGGKEVGGAFDADFIDARFKRDVPTWTEDFCRDPDSFPRVCPEIDASKDDGAAIVIESEVLPAVVHRAITSMIKEI